VLTGRLREADEQASSMSFQRVKERTQGVLQRIAREAEGGDAAAAGRRITPSLTHQQIADMVGTSRETVTRVVKQLKQDGWLEQRRKRYVVPAAD
jgi:CRP/FNR family transcriptional regulator